MDYRLGQSVEFNSWLFRDTVETTVKGDPPGQKHAKSKTGLWLDFVPITTSMRRVWKRTETHKPLQGIVTGKRTLVEGDLSMSGYKQALKNCKYLTVYLVVTNIRQKPFRVLPDDITPLDL